MTIRLRILCWMCAEAQRELLESEGGLVVTASDDLAADPNKVDMNYLVCPPWGMHNPMIKTRIYNCDECEGLVSVGYKSDWLLEEAGR